jgi:hypothetical protein
MDGIVVIYDPGRPLTHIIYNVVSYMRSAVTERRVGDIYQAVNNFHYPTVQTSKGFSHFDDFIPP